MIEQMSPQINSQQLNLPPVQFPMYSALKDSAFENTLRQTITDSIRPLQEQIRRLSAPAITQPQARQDNTIIQQRSTVSHLGTLMQLAIIANSVLDQARLEKIYATYINEVAERAVKGQLVDGIKEIATRELLAFAQTSEGKEWLQMGVDVFFGLKQK